MARFLVLALALAPLAGAMTPSAGCGSATSLPLGALTQHDPITVNGSDVARHFVHFVPADYAGASASPLPLQVWAHGQYGHAMQEAKASKFIDYPIVSIYPQGLDDAADADCGTGWNTGPMGHDASTCDKTASTCCYSSCRTSGACSADSPPAGAADVGAACGWASCADDTTFVAAMIETIAAEVCIDLDAVLMSGGSNGGMLTHAAYQALPGTFSTVMPVYGLPLQGHNVVPAANARASILLLHDRSDGVIPPAGGYAGGWYYESADDVLGTWAALHGCDAASTDVATAFDGGSTNLACSEWLNCG